MSSVVKRGGIPASDTNKHLIRQFCRGCWDNTVITNLQLEQKKDKPPSFSELLLLLRTEEDRQLTKENRMKKHISSSKQRVNLHSQSTCACGAKSEYDFSAIEDLRKQMNKLQSQLASLISQKKTQSTPRPESRQVNATKLQVLLCQKPQTNQSPGNVLNAVRMVTLLHHAAMQPTQLW